MQITIETTNGILAAEYTNGGKRRAATVDITRIVNGERTVLHTYEVSGRGQARGVAQRFCATPWNF